MVFTFNLLYIGLNAQAPSTISGHITSSNKEELVGATIIINASSDGTFSDINGKYEFSKLKNGTYTLTATYLGFLSQSKTIEINNASHVELNFSLQENSKELETVYITEKTDKARIETKGFAVNALDFRDLEVQSIQATEVLDRTAGVRIRQSGGMGSRINYNINGLSGHAVRIFIDGIPASNYGPSFSLSSIPASMIKRIEVYKGVVPADLGDDALGGAINIILNTNAKNSLAASYSFGSFNTHQASINGSYRDPSTGITLTASGFLNSTDNSYKVWGDQVYITDIKTGNIEYIKAKRFHDDYLSRGLKAEIGITNKSWADQFHVGVIASDLDRAIQHGATMESVYGSRRATQNTVQVNSTYKKKGFLVKNLDINLYGSFSKLERNIIDTIPLKYNWKGELTPDYWDLTDGEWLEHITGAEGNRPSLSSTYENVVSARGNLTYRINPYHRIVGNYTLSGFKRNTQDPLLEENLRKLMDTRFLTKQIFGAAYEITAFDNKFQSSLFLKYFNQDIEIAKPELVQGELDPIINRFDKLVNETGYGIALSYQLTPTIQIMVSAENALRLPETHELFGNDIENVEESYILKPERSKNLNLGFNFGTFNFSQNTLKVNTNFFIRDTKDKIKLDVTTDQTAEVSSYINDDSYFSSGVDVEVKYTHQEKLCTSLGTSIFNSRFNTEFDENGVPYQWYKNRERNAPFFTANLNTRYYFSNFLQSDSKTTINYNIGYVHAFYRDWSSLGGEGKDIIPSQLVNDIGISYTFPKDKITMSFDVKNIFNEQVFDNYALQRPGRAFYVKMFYKII
ncbi:TonB-dependent receptor [Portibacter lacus]|uniref:TonB-dependent receptor n=1 Tax=Portibacter lacus TaxID=1099794 RepID=A0AA37SMF5_9BACT|nr:TonB-dependent receptor [Portibacter lacus]GLR16039.1 TonB-dependent receptor [Portibacter lacus]